jgi:MFS family permease
MEAGSQARRFLLGAMFADTIGSGLWAPFELLYGNKVAHLSLPTAGAVLAVASIGSIALGPVAGAAVDRVGPFRIVALANTFGLSGCLLVAGWPSIWGYGAGTLLLGASSRSFWGAFTPFVASIAGEDELEHWFGRFRSMRFVGLGLGEALTGVALAAGQTTGLRLIVLADGASFLASLLLVTLAGRERRRTAVPEEDDAEPAPKRGYRQVLADRPNTALAALNVVPTLLIIAPLLGMPVYVLNDLHLPSWLPGVLAALATGTVACAAWVSGRLLRGRRRLRNLEVAAFLWGVSLLLFFAGPLATVIAVSALAASMILMGLAEAVYAPTADALPAALAPPGMQGRYAAVHQFAWGISDTIAPAVSGALLATNEFALWVVLAGLAFGAVLAYRALERLLAGRDGIAGAAQAASA